MTEHIRDLETKLGPLTRQGLSFRALGGSMQQLYIFYSLFLGRVPFLVSTKITYLLNYLEFIREVHFKVGPG